MFTTHVCSDTLPINALREKLFDTTGWCQHHFHGQEFFNLFAEIEYYRPYLMPDKLSCPYCGSPEVRLWEAVLTIRIVDRPEGGPGVKRKCPVYRCLACGRSFDEVEAQESQEPEEGGGPSFD